MKITFPDIEGNIEVYMDCLRAICGETEGRSMIDLGCCFAPNTPKLGFKKRTYVDVVDRVLDHADEQQFFTKADILEFLQASLSWAGIKWDVAICTDVIEHLTVDDGHRLLHDMVRKSDKQILFTPLDNLFGMAEDHDKNPEAHRSLWTPEMFRPYFDIEWAFIIFPQFHKQWNGGAFFSWRVNPGQMEMKTEFQRVLGALSEKQWFINAINNGTAEIHH